MKKIAILATGLSMLLCSCGNSPLYKGLIGKEYTGNDEFYGTKTYIFQEDNLTVFGGDWRNVQVYTITWTKEMIQLDMYSQERKECIAVYYFYTDEKPCHRVGYFTNTYFFYPNGSSEPFGCK